MMMTASRPMQGQLDDDVLWAVYRVAVLGAI